MTLAKRFSLNMAMEEIAKPTIAQEGIFGDVGNWFKRGITSEKSIYNYAVSALNQTPIEQVVVKDAAWAKIFTKNGKIIEGTDILEKINEFQQSTVGLVTQSTDILKQIEIIPNLILQADLKYNNTGTDTEILKELIAIKHQLENSYFDIQDKYNYYHYNRATTGVKTGTAADVQKVAGALVEYIDNKKNIKSIGNLTTYLVKLEQMITKVTQELYKDPMTMETRIRTVKTIKSGPINYIVKEIINLCFNLNTVIRNKIVSYIMQHDRLQHGAYMYLKLSLE